MKFGVIIFPGSNCDHDSYYAAITATGQQATMLWHDSHDLENCDAIIVPGGFAYGDYLRTGAIARFAPIMQEVAKFAASGGLVIGICNGFQILCEAGLLPGALMRNAGLHFVCRDVPLKVENSQTAFTSRYDAGEAIVIPVAHHDGNYQADPETLDRLEGEGRIAFRYAGECNGSARDIAGIVSEAGNVLGMMPHPERMVEPAHGGTDGRRLFEGILETIG